jgi:glycosyltransferase involved in cell wall biosynthesis
MDGVSLTVRNYALWLNRKMGDTYVITPSYPGYEDSEEFKVLRYASVPVPMRRPYRIGLPSIDRKLYRQLQKIPFDIFHCHSPFSAGRYALRMARRRHIPIIATFHSKYRDDFLRAVHIPVLANAMLKRVIEFYSAVDEVWIPQASVEETLREYGYKGACTVMENGTDFDLQSIGETKANARATLGLGDEPVFLFVGQMILEKNLSLIIESLALMRDMNYSAFFVGQGYAAEQLKQLADRCGISEKVHFTGTIYDRQLLKSYYAAADLFLFPSLYDNAPLVVREAAAMHTPALLARNSTAAEVIVDGMNGFLAENNRDAVAAKIRQIISSPETLQDAGRNAAKTIVRSWEDIIDSVKQRYLMLIEMKSHRSRSLPPLSRNILPATV